MYSARFTTQIITLLLQIYFFLQTVLLHTLGYAFFPFQPIESGWSSMIFTIIVACGCELFGLIDAILLILTKRSIYHFSYLALVLACIVLFVNYAYFSTAGTVVCLVCYGILLAMRLFNFTADLIAISKGNASSSPLQ